MVRELSPARLDCVEDTIGRNGVVTSDVLPDGDKVLVRLSGSANGEHCQRFSSALAAKRRRASALMSSIEAWRLGPLSIPSCASSRSSFTV